MKVLMLGPGEPSIYNSGLGIATKHIKDNLPSDIDLTVIQPGTDQGITKNARTISDEKVIETTTPLESKSVIEEEIKEIITQTNLNPYFYGTPSIAASTTKIEQNNIQKSLEEFSQKTIETASENSCDLVYAHDWMNIKAAITLKEKWSAPFILHIHSLDYDRATKITNSWVYKLEKEGMIQADLVIAVSEYHKSVMVEKYGIDPIKIHVVHLATEIPSKVDHQSKFAEKLIVFAGRLTEQKGPDKFIQIATKVHNENPDTRFVIAGSGELMEHLIESGIHHDLKGKLHFTGYISRDELFKLYAMADVYCMPSVSEPFGLSAIEAAAHDLPVVLSKQCGAAELLPASYLADFWDIDAFVDHILDILNDDDIAKKAAKKNISALSERSWRDVTQEITSIFKLATSS